MKRTFTILCLLATVVLVSCTKEKSGISMDPVDYVNPLTGTASSFELSTGNTYPAIAMPWGMNFWTPQTGRNGNGWTYTYSATKIRGLKQTHQPSPWINDYGAFSIMPVTKGPVYDEEGRQSWFSHKAETVKPYYYKVYLAEHDVVAELAPTERAAAFRLTYPQKDTSYLVIDAYRGGHVEIDKDNNRVIGYSVENHGGVTENFHNWFVVESDMPFETGLVDGSIAMVGFKTARGQQVNLRVASSFISAEQAGINLSELGHRTLDEIAEAGRSRWNEVLGRIKVEDPDIDNVRTFYSCLYRSVLFPRDLSEINGEGKRVHYSPFNGKVCEGYLFGDTGFWDTFRSLFPLVDLVYPDQGVKMQEGLVNTWKESGFLPEWASPGHRGCMVGNNSASVVAGAYIKGLRGYDAEELWKAVTHGAHAVHPTISSTGRLGWEYYDSLGYVPCDVGIRENAARTLEYAYDDWCIYTFGKALGKSEEELAPYAKSALNYRNLFDPEYKLMVGKNQDGSFSRPFSPLKWGGDFTEGNSLHYTWSVFHDPQGLIDLMGGDDDYIAMLDSVFNIPPLFDDSYYGFPIHEIREMQVMNMGNYAHGNQPIQHMLYMYDWGGQPWKAQMRIREAMDKLYNSNFDGYCGDEDNGQTSAWYVFSALGFYPVCPASDEYAIGTPLFRKATVSLPNGKSIVLEAPGNSKENFYIGSLSLNGKSWSKNYFKHGDLVRGARISYKMSSSPNRSRGTAQEDRPYSFSR
ncbi:MAG: GH92 family glycosyl hydrolase [Bacteroidales bacterium]|nr:GH92 family glycosyl hydrolase [Bacteroidales bacterium]